MSNSFKLIESIQNNLKEGALDSIPDYQTFDNVEAINSNATEGGCKIAAMKAHIQDNAEEVYVGVVKTTDGTEITHWFNVKDGKVLDHSYQANHDEIQLNNYKGIDYSQVLLNQGFKPDNQMLGDAAFIDEKGNVVTAYNMSNKILFKYNNKEISYNELKNLKGGN